MVEQKDLKAIIEQVLTEMNVSDGATASCSGSCCGSEKPPHRMALKLRTAVGTMLQLSI